MNSEVFKLRTLLQAVLSGSATAGGDWPHGMGSVRDNDTEKLRALREHRYCHEGCVYRQAWEYLDTVEDET